MNNGRVYLLLAGLVIAGAPIGAWTQQAAPLPKVGILSPAKRVDMACLPNNQSAGAGCLLEALHALGYSDGRNVAFDFRFAEGAAERLPALAAELVATRPDVIYTYTTGGADAAARATTTIPIVVGPAGERTMERLAGNFARPIGNVTGLTLSSVGQDEKCLQLLKELAPRTKRVAFLLNPDNPNYGTYMDLLRPVAGRLDILLTRVGARNAAEFPQAFATIRDSGADAVLVADDAALTGTKEVRKQIIQWALAHRLPMASTSARVAPDGGLVSLGTDNSALARRAASYVHRILGGAKISDLPVERPTVYKLTVNRKTAKALGLTIPQPLLLRADELIE